MKAILISINSKWVAKILNGEKTIEIRKTMPKCDLPIEVYIYCTKERHWLVRLFNGLRYLLNLDKDAYSLTKETTVLNGKVVAKFTLKEVYTYTIEDQNTWKDKGFEELVEETMCLTLDELHKYVGDKTFYGWKIDDLKIFDEPKELKIFKGYKKVHKCDVCPISNVCIGFCGMNTHRTILKSLEKAPQSWCYVEAERLCK